MKSLRENLITEVYNWQQELNKSLENISNKMSSLSIDPFIG